VVKNTRGRGPDIKPNHLLIRKIKQTEKNILRIKSVQKARHILPIIFIQKTTPSSRKKQVADLQNHSNNTSSKSKTAKSSTNNSGTTGRSSRAARGTLGS
jgi:hypothetical protein